MISHLGGLYCKGLAKTLKVKAIYQHISMRTEAVGRSHTCSVMVCIHAINFTTLKPILKSYVTSH